jgi:hypothetical protein
VAVRIIGKSVAEFRAQANKLTILRNEYSYLEVTRDAAVQPAVLAFVDGNHGASTPLRLRKETA